MDGFVVNENRTVFLNEMDGFRNNEGLLIIASSNHPGKIDEALLRELTSDEITDRLAELAAEIDLPPDAPRPEDIIRQERDRR